MKPLTAIQAKLFAAEYAEASFSYFNDRTKRNHTVILIRNPRQHKNSPKSNKGDWNYSELLASEYSERMERIDEQRYIERGLPLLTSDQIAIISTTVREMLRR